MTGVTHINVIQEMSLKKTNGARLKTKEENITQG